ncbi:hypothetical protein EMWEY_00022200 [Eimeria maxima]|uniref:Transmembrane protein n=1 Tax=Eimeria maxima TaxID=5804 RepID=U6MCR0_EIMMA|nr:hypothetical protein EMWEY_00022200 [Eimeria maxima]CDJ59450.1 hypothetical protein EMWEY_00022200 [Eimeria maxima]
MRPSGDQQYLATHKLPCSLSTGSKLGESSLAFNPYSGEDIGSQLPYPPQHSGPARSRLRNLPRPVSLVATISVVLIIVSLWICMPLRSREWLSGVTNRRLSQGGEGIDEDELSVIEGCLDLEADMGVLKDRATSGSTNDSSDRVTELVSMLSEAAAAKESVEERLPVGGEVDSSGQWLEGRTGFEYEDSDMRFLPTSSKQAFVENGEFTDVTPALDPDSWMDTIPSISIQPGEPETKEGFLAAGDEDNSGKSSVSPSRTISIFAGFSDGPVSEEILNHPFVRLPVLEEGVVPRYFRPSNLYANPTRRSSFQVYLTTLRELYAQKTLSQRDVYVLQTALERLVATVQLRTPARPKREFPCFIVEILGSRFMALDAIVCAIELLGDYMSLPLWWEKFTAGIKAVPLRSARSRGGDMAEFNRHLATRLLAALDIYKEGRRPPLKEVYALKVLLLCPPFGRPALKDRKWDRWRHDGKCS